MGTRGKKGKTDKQMFDERNRENVIHILEQVWCLEPEDTLYKIFHKHSKGEFLHPAHVKRKCAQSRVERVKRRCVALRGSRNR